MDLLLSNQIACSELISEEQSMSDCALDTGWRRRSTRHEAVLLVWWCPWARQGKQGKLFARIFLPLCTIYYSTEIPIRVEGTNIFSLYVICMICVQADVKQCDFNKELFFANITSVMMTEV